MIRSIKIENYKSIRKMDLSLGRLNIFIGENGAGKSNILEAIALASAAESRKLDNEFLTSRGIRVTDPKLMRSAFDKKSSALPITISAFAESGTEYIYKLRNDNKSYSEWHNLLEIRHPEELSMKFLTEFLSSLNDSKRKEFLNEFKSALENALVKVDSSERQNTRTEPKTFKINVSSEGFKPEPNNDIADFIIYSPENSALRMFEREGQILPLGVNGEGLLKLLSVMSKSANSSEMEKVKESLCLLNWFEDFTISGSGSRAKMKIIDRYIDPMIKGLDHRSANEGFLFVTFYLALFASSLTPRFFAVDNVDASLNPKLCEKMIRTLDRIAIESGKQAILTTHNPAALDGIDLTDDEQRLFIISRGRDGETKARRFSKKPTSATPSRLSEMFMSGALGGLPKSF